MPVPDMSYVDFPGVMRPDGPKCGTSSTYTIDRDRNEYTARDRLAIGRVFFCTHHRMVISLMRLVVSNRSSNPARDSRAVREVKAGLLGQPPQGERVARTAKREPIIERMMTAKIEMTVLQAVLEQEMQPA
jgi:hypothetical protein